MNKWHTEDPAFLNAIEAEVENNFNGLRVVIIDQKIFIKGRFEVFEDGVRYDTYGISVELSDDHPQNLPRVFETNGRIPKKARRHVNEDGSACLFVPFETRIYWPNPRSIGSFLGGPVNAYFYGQSYFEKTGKYPFGERDHDIVGVFEAIRDHSGMNNLAQALSVFDLLKKHEMKGHWLCPCGSQMILRRCHLEKIDTLKEMIGRSNIAFISERLNYLKNQMVDKRRRENQIFQQLAAGI